MKATGTTIVKSNILCRNYINFGFRIVDFGLFCLAVLPDAVKIAVSSSASLIISCIFSFLRRLASAISSSQNRVSSHSSSTIVILEMKSALLLALQAER